MMIDDYIHDAPLTPYSFPQEAWVSGAAAGLKILEPRTPKHLWEDFISDVFDMISFFGDIEPTKPGAAPKYGDGRIGSAYDALGGYVSVVGEVCPEGLFFRVPLAHLEQVLELLKDMTLFRAHGEILVRNYDLPAFTRLVPLMGPVAEQLDMEVVL